MTDLITMFIVAIICAITLIYVLAPAKGHMHALGHALGVALCALALFLWSTQPLLYLP